MGAEKNATLMEMIETLPEELGEEILVRLPIKSLLRISCVSKAWHKFVSKAWCNPCFGHKHSSFWRNKNHVSATFMLRTHAHGSGGSFAREEEALNIYSYANDNLAVSRRLALPICDEHLVGSCDGILCLFSYHNTIRLSNPITKRSVILPSSTKIFANHHHRCVDYLGFGYDSSTNDYKVVRRWHSGNNASAEKHVVEVYKLSTKVWTLVESTSPLAARFQPSPFGVHVKGFCYWWDYALQRIITFDFESEKFGIIYCPNEFIYILMFSQSRNKINSQYLGVFDDSIALFVFTGESGYNRRETGSSIVANVWVKRSEKDDPRGSHFIRKLCVRFTADVSGLLISNFIVVRNGDVTTLLLVWLNGILTEVEVGKGAQEDVGCVVINQADSRSRMMVHSEFNFFAQSVPFQPSLISLRDFDAANNRGGGSGSRNKSSSNKED